MTVRLKFSGITVEADTPEEAAKTLQILREQQSEQDRRHALARAHQNMNPSLITEDALLRTFGNPWDGVVFMRFLERLGRPQRRVLEMLLTEEQVTDEALRNALSIKGNQALAGVLSGISKQAAALNVPAREVFEVENFRSEGKRRSTYRVAPNFRQRAREMSWPAVTNFNA